MTGRGPNCMDIGRSGLGVVLAEGLARHAVGTREGLDLRAQRVHLDVRLRELCLAERNPATLLLNDEGELVLALHDGVDVD